MRGALLSLTFFALLIAAAPAQAATERPNIVVIMTDDQTVESMRVMPIVKAQLADQGATFTRSFASFPLCCPSRATFLTGQYAHNHGVQHNTPPNGGFQKLDSSNTLPVWLQRAGYHTGHIGKYLNGYGGNRPTLVPPGWTEWYGSVDPSTYWFYRYTLNENGRLVTYGNDPASYQTDVYSAKAVDFVRRRAPFGPYFLSLAFLAPHSGRPVEPGDPPGLLTPVPAPRHRGRFATEPLPTPPSFNNGVSDKPFPIRDSGPLRPQRIAAITRNYRQRLESLLAVDDAVGALVQALRETGELDNTLIIFTSDNGFFHGEYRIVDGKLRVYEPSIKVPFIMRGPGVRRGVQVGNLVANIDTAPTILDAANAGAGRPLDGRSLFPLIRDSRREWGRDILLETTGHGGNSYAAIRTRRYLYAEYARGERELYNLEQDPYEVRNLSGDGSSATVSGLVAGRLSSLRGCSARSCRVKPKLSLRLRYRRGRLRGRRCARGAVRGTVRGDERRYVERVSFFVNRRRAVRDRRYPHSRRISGRRFRNGRRSRLRALAELIDGRAVSIDRRVRACR